VTSTPARPWTPWLVAALGYTCLTIVCTWPLVARLSSALPHDAGDPLFSTWILWWNAHARPLSLQWWNAPIFWPLTGALALSEHFLGLSLVASPLQWLGAEPVTAYNVVFLLAFPLSALAAHALAYTLTARHQSAAVAGLAYAFNPYRLSQISHVQMLWVFWTPLALLALHRYGRDGRPRWLLLFGAMCVGQALSNTYFSLFFPLLLALWSVWFLLRPGRFAKAGWVAALWAASVCLLLPVIVQYHRLGPQFGLERTYDEIREFSATFGAFMSVPSLALSSAVLPTTGNSEQHLFPGFAVLVLVGGAAIASLSRADPARRAWRRGTLVFASAATAAVVVAALAPIVGPWHIDLGTVRIVSVSTAMKPLTAALWLGLFALLLTRRLERAWVEESAFAFYVIGAIAMYALTLGPEPAIFDKPFWYWPPYAWLLELPGFSNVRVPGRFAMLGMLCLAVSAAIAFERIRSRMSPRAGVALTVIACAAVCADGSSRRLPIVDLPTRAALVGAPVDSVVVELPLGRVYDDIAAMYRSIYTGHPLVNGYSGFDPIHYQILRYALEEHDMDVLNAVAVRRPVVVVEAERVTTLSPAREDALPDEPVLRPQSVAVDARAIDPSPIFDGDRTTRWTSGAPQRGTEAVTIDLGSSHTVSGLVMRLGIYRIDYPRSLSIETSGDEIVWTTQWTGRCAGKTVTAALTNPADLPLSFTFAPIAARWVRLRQLGSDPHAAWSIADLTIHGR
jgi:hypothetical protein